jgi:hypothetical protein
MAEPETAKKKAAKEKETKLDATLRLAFQRPPA